MHCTSMWNQKGVCSRYTYFSLIPDVLSQTMLVRIIFYHAKLLLHAYSFSTDNTSIIFSFYTSYVLSISY